MSDTDSSVVEVLSDSPPAPVQRIKRPKTTRLQRSSGKIRAEKRPNSFSSEEVIEITDSEDERPPPSTSAQGLMARMPVSEQTCAAVVNHAHVTQESDIAHVHPRKQVDGLPIMNQASSGPNEPQQGMGVRPELASQSNTRPDAASLAAIAKGPVGSVGVQPGKVLPDEAVPIPIPDTVTSFDPAPRATLVPPQPPTCALPVLPNDGPIAANPLLGPVVPPPLPAPTEEVDPLQVVLAQILEIVPDVHPDHALSLITQYHPQYQHEVVQPVLHLLFENPDYPKADRNGKRKIEDPGPGMERDSQRRKLEADWVKNHREGSRGRDYADLAVVRLFLQQSFRTALTYGHFKDQLVLDYPLIPKTHIRKIFASHNGLYAPTFLTLRAQEALPSPPYTRKHYRPYHEPGKGKSRLRHDAEFEEERAWVVSWVQAEREKEDEKMAEEMRRKECEAAGEGLECGCCFSMEPFVSFIFIFLARSKGFIVFIRLLD
jgi:hypothetical protein